MIVKVQVPMATNTTPTVLIYNKSRTVEAELPITEDLKKKMGNSFKLYFHAKLKDKIIHIGDEAPWQYDW